MSLDSLLNDGGNYSINGDDRSNHDDGLSSSIGSRTNREEGKIPQCSYLKHICFT